MTASQVATIQYLLPSPAGALQAVSGGHGPIRDALRGLLRARTTVELSHAGLTQALPHLGASRAANLVAHLHRDQLVELHDRPYQLGGNKLEIVLPDLLTRLSATGRGLLADNEGFLVSSAGYPADLSTRLAALAADLVDFDTKWRGYVGPEDPTEPPTWSTSGPEGAPSFSLHILTIGRYPFVLLLEGEPRLIDPALVWLVWSLSHRYDR